MKFLGLIFASTIAWSSISAIALAEDNFSDQAIVSQTTVNIRTDADGKQVQFTTVSIDRADLRQPHILRVRGSINNTAIPMQRVDVKLNGKVIKSIANSSLELNLAPLMMAKGRYEVEVAGTTNQSDVTISLKFTGPNTQVNQQSSGAGEIAQKLVINVR
jgi:hypothetical protein